MKKIISTVIVAVFLLGATSLAALTIEINKSIDKPFPIAVVPFSGPSLQSNVTDTIATDLSNSGRFEVAALHELPQKPHESTQINWSKWTALDTEYLVIGKVTANSNQTYNVQFQVISQLGNHALTGRVFKNIPADRMNVLGHTIANYVYQAVTGQRGYFTTKLAYIDVSDPYNLRKAQYSLIIADYDGQNPQVLLSQKRNPLASPVWSPDGSQLAYVSYINGRMAVYSIALKTGKRTLIANYPGINSSPAFVPKSKNLVVALSKKANSATTQLYLTKPNVKGVIKQLTYSGINTSPAVSPDGKLVAFTSTRGGQPQIYVMKINGLSAKRLTFSGVQNFDPKFTPDGKDIVFMHQAESGGAIGIAKLDLKSGEMTMLTNGPVDKSPSVSPDGSMVIYTNTHEHGALGLGMVSLNGRIHINLPASSHQVNIESPAWSPFL